MKPIESTSRVVTEEKLHYLDKMTRIFALGYNL